MTSGSAYWFSQLAQSFSFHWVFENKHTELLKLTYTLFVRDTECLVFHWLLLMVPFFPKSSVDFSKRNGIRFSSWPGWSCIRGRTVLWPKWHRSKYFKGTGMSPAGHSLDHLSGAPNSFWDKWCSFSLGSPWGQEWALSEWPGLSGMS